MGCMLLSSVRDAGPNGGASQLGLLLVWTLLQVAGPGMLYPLAASQLQQWWRQKLGRVQVNPNPNPNPSPSPSPSPSPNPNPNPNPSPNPSPSPNQMAAESAACVLGMVVMPAIVSAASACTAGDGASVDDRPFGEDDLYSSDCPSDAGAYSRWSAAAGVHDEHDMQARLAHER